MNKNAIKKFAIEARKKLIDSVTDKAGMLGITEKSCSEPITKGADFEVYQTVAGTEATLNRKQCEQRRRLVFQIESRGFEAVVEEVSYTWFNRICAIRFMEVNDYLPNRVRVLSSEKEGKMEPDLVTQALDVDLDLTAQEKEEIINWKMSGTSEDTDKMYCKLFLKQCHQLHDILPGLFEADANYMELLFGISYTNKDDVIYMLVNPETGIPEADFNVSTLDEEGNPTGQVEIIGWLYQYYNTELKDDTFAKLKKNVKITKERIPAATQLFTPDWIVRYMVENSVGRIWIEHLRAVDPTTDEKATAERFGWKYYLPEAKQEESVNIKLAEIRTTYKDLKPTDITCIDPCMGSGHILIAMFDVLMDIYESTGYDKREAAFEIVEHNIHGLDIDQRAYQLAYFAVMMKGRGYNRRFLRGRDGKPEPKVYAIVESNDINRNHLQFFGMNLSEMERNVAMMQIEGLLDTFKDAREYGSILNVDACDWNVLERFVDDLGTTGQISFESMGSEETQESLRKLVKIAKNLGEKYDAVVTNPPYMGASGMGTDLSKYVKKNYPDSKSDLFAVFIEKCGHMAKENAYQAMITQQSWMFLSSFEKLRGNLLNMDIINMVHLGARAFEEIGGEVVQTTSFVIRDSHIEKFNGVYCRLIEPTTQLGKEKMFLNCENRYYAEHDTFAKIPGNPIAYWVGEKVFWAFENCPSLKTIARARSGAKTGKNEIFIMNWWEVIYEDIGFNIKTYEECLKDTHKWYPHNKGGNFRNWYGNRELVVRFEHGGEKIREYAQKNGNAFDINATDVFFHEGLTWTALTSYKNSFRYSPAGCVFDTNKGPMMFNTSHDILMYLLAFMISPVAQFILKALNQSLSLQNGDVDKVPIILDKDNLGKIVRQVEHIISLVKSDYDESELSFDFCFRVDSEKSCKAEYENLREKKEKDFKKIKSISEELNAFFIRLYDLKDILIPDITEKDIASCCEIPDETQYVKSFISYAVGCMFGRYSLDVDGLAYAGGEWDDSKYVSFVADRDNIIPICDDEYFEDDIVGLFVEFVKTVYGADSLEENLDFIANALGNKGATSREVIRNYFLKDFYKDHLKTYQKRPIYWMFDSGKQNGFKALIYMHRYDADTVGRVRTDYLHQAQRYVETAMQSAQYTIDNASSASEKSKATKAVTKYTKQLAEMKIYDEAIAHIVNQRIEIDLDDGVKVNYAKFQGVEVAQEGKKALKVDLLAKIK